MRDTAGTGEGYGSHYVGGFAEPEVGRSEHDDYE